MKVLALVIVALIASSSATSLTQKFPFDYSNKRSIMSVMMQVEAKIKSKSPLDAILNVLTEFRDAVNTEQVNHDQIYNSQRAECESEDAFRRQQVTDATNVLRDSTNQLNSCNTQKIRVNNGLEQNEQNTFANEEHQRIVQAQRQAEQSYANKRAQFYEDALQAIDEASDILAGIFSGSHSFVQVSAVTKKMLQNAVDLKALNQYAPVLSSLAQLAAKERQLDESALERVAQLLDNLRSNVQAAQAEFQEHDAASVEAFNEQNERLQNNLNRMAAQAEKLTDELDRLNQCVGTQSAIAQTSSNKQQRNQQLWDQATALCGTFSNEYNYATASRRQELQLVAELEEMVEKRFGQVEDENAERQARIQEETQA